MHGAGNDAGAWMLALAVGALGMGPALWALAQVTRRASWLLAALDGFVLTSVGGLALVFLLPGAVVAGGAIAVLGVLAGLAAPFLIERAGGRAERHADTVVLGLGVAGLIVHTGIDGMALSDAGLALPLAVVLHRAPVGLAVWALVRPRRGARAAIIVLATIAASTTLGFLFGESLVGGTSPAGFAFFEAFVAGSLAHVVIHAQPDHAQPDLTDDPDPRAALLGALIGLLLIVCLPDMEHSHGQEALFAGFEGRFVHLALETAPPLLLGYAIAVGLSAVLPRATRWLGTSTTSSLGAALRGMLVGVPIPVCSCGVVPIYRSLVGAGAPTAAAMAFLVATPELGAESILISLPLLGGEMTAARVASAMIVALLAGWWVGARAPVTIARGAGPCGETAGGWRGGVASARQIIDETAPWLLLGLGVAAAMDPTIVGAWVAALPRGLDVPLFALVGMPMYVCASGATPLAAALIGVGVSPGAAIAFLLAGPATNVTTFGILTDLHGRRTAAAFAATVGLCAIALGSLINWTLDIAPTGIHTVAREDHSLLAWLAVGVLTLIFLASVARQGPRRFVGRVLPAMISHRHSHEHGDRRSSEGGCCDRS